MSDATPPTLTLEHTEEDGVTIIALAGELDIASINEVESVLGPASWETERLCLDLSALEFIDSTGLAAIIRAHTAMAERNARFVIVCVEGAVRRTFETTGLTGMLVLSSSRASALRDLRV